MKNGLATNLMIALSLSMLLPAAMATPIPLPTEPGAEVIQPIQTEPRPKPESKPVVPDTGPRGQLLFENHCKKCHTSAMNVRETNRVRSLKDLEYWVSFWSRELKLPWRADEISDVVEYLNQRYYKIEEPSKQPR
jgi:hypothetical protein